MEGTRAGRNWGLRPTIAIALGISLALNVLLAYRFRQVISESEALRILGRLPQAGLQYPLFKGVTVQGDTAVIGSAPEGTRQLLLITNRTCPYCTRTIPLWGKLVREMRTNGLFPLQAYAIALDTAATTVKHLDSLGLSVPVVEFPEPRLARLARAIQIPQTIVIDHEGRIRFAHVGVFGTEAGIDSLRRAVGLPGSFGTKKAQLKGE